MQEYFAEEFKREAVRRALLGDVSRARLAKELAVSENSLRAWIRLYGPSSTGPERDESLARDLEAENARLRRENDRLRQERDILKKAVGILSEETGERR